MATLNEEKMTRGQLNQDIPAGYKICYVCKFTKTLDEFGLNSTRADGKQTYCRACAKAQQTKWYYSRKHGITLEARDEMLKSQNGKCKICSINIKFEDQQDRENKNTSTAAVLDHCHTSLKKRGILCGACNSGLGSFKDNVDSLLSAANYLLSNSE